MSKEGEASKSGARKTVSVVIPAWNEEESIGQVLAAIPTAYVDEILVVDGESSDRTAQIARAAGARVIVEARRGYGRACASGAAQASGDRLAFLDADGADDPAQLPDLLALMDAQQARLALGSRLAGHMQRGAMPWHQKTGNWLCAGLINRLYGSRLSDLSPFRVVERAGLRQLDMQEMTYGWPTEMIVKALRRGWRVAEAPVDYRARLGGKSKISGTARGTVLATYFIFKVILTYARA